MSVTPRVDYKTADTVIEGFRKWRSHSEQQEEPKQTQFFPDPHPGVCCSDLGVKSWNQKMLKVNTNKGKFDIVLDEENLFKNEARHRVAKGRQSSKGSSPQTHPLPPKTSRLKQNEKTKPIPKSQKKDASESRLTKNQSRKGQASEDAGYVTKDQLSRILLSLQTPTEASHSPPDHGLQYSQGPVAQQTVVYEPSIRGNQQSRKESKTEQNTLEGTIGNYAEEQVNISRKSFQWKKELDEQIAMKETLKAKRNFLENEVEEYDPWGRPGGGAPVRTKSGSVVADYKKMHQDMFSKSDTKMTSISAADLRSKHFVATATESCNTHDVITTTVPVAMRSSFAVGAPGVVKYENYQSKIDEKKKWLQDLEQQIKEKKEKQAQEKLQQLHKEAREESWNQIPVKSNETHVSPPGPTVASSVVASKHESPLNIGASTVLENSFRAGNFHARGHGLQTLGDVDQDELDRKRLKTLEHQRAIKEQVEEKRRLKQEEKDRRLKEEAEKEEALKLERERLQKEYREELKLRQEKEDEARQRAEALEKSILQAHETAQQEKAAKRIKHLELGGHDVSGLRSPGLGAVQQYIEGTDTSPHNKVADLSSVTHNQSSPSQTQQQEAPANDTVSSATRQKDASFESELKELSLKVSLESEWTSSSPRNNSQTKSRLKASPTPVLGAGHIKTRSQSERSQRKKQTYKQRNKRQSSLDNCRQSEDTGNVSAVPPPLEDSFMIPYTRTSSATFSAVPGTPLSHQSESHKDPAAVDRNKPTLKKPQSINQAHRTTVSSLSQKSLGHRQTVRKDNMVEKRSESPRGRQRMAKQHPKKGDSLSRTTEIRKDKQGKSIIQEQHPDVYAVQASPERLPTARQEMILQQLAALRQGLMLKERELHHGVL